MTRPQPRPIDPGAPRAVAGEPGLLAGQHFLFVQQPLESAGAQLRWLAERGGGGRTVPLWGRTYELDGATIRGPDVEPLTLAAVATDKDVYREGDDAAAIVVVDPARPDEEVTLDVTLSGRPFRRLAVHLDWNGMAVRMLHDLVAGKYEVRAGDGATTSFEVAGYSLAPMAASARETVLTGEGLACTLDLTSLAKPVSGRVRVVVMQDGKPVHGPVVLESIDGVLQASFPLDGEGPFVAHVAGVDDPGLEAQIPLRGTARKERERTWLARLGAELAASVLKLEGGQACRGLWIREEGRNNAPVQLAQAVAEVGRLEARELLHDVVLTVVHPGERRIAHRAVGALEPGQVVEFGVQPPFSFALIGGFAGDRPWEGTAGVLAPADVGLELDLPAKAAPRTTLPVTIRTGRPRGESSVFLVVRDARLKPMDHPLTRLGAELKDAIETHQALKPDIQERRPDFRARRLYAASPAASRAPRHVPPWAVGAGRMKIGELLVAAGSVTAAQVDEALRRQKQTGKRLGQILIEMRVATERDVTEALSWQLDVPFIDLASYIIDPAIARLIPEHIAQRHQMIPINKVGDRLTIAMVDPLNVLAIDDVQLMTGLSARRVIAPPTDLQKALQDTYGAQSKLDQVFGELDSIDMDADKVDDLDSFGELGENDAPIIRLVNLIFTQAASEGVDAIDIEPGDRQCQVWYHGAGGRRVAMQPPAKSHGVILGRIKAMARIDASIRNVAQDGVIRIKTGDREMDISVRTVPGPFGETVHMRIGPAVGAAPPRPARASGVPARDRFPEVVFAGLVHVRGQATVPVALGDALGLLEVDAFALHQGDWEGVTRPVEVASETFGELTVPAFVHPDDRVQGRLDAGWASAPVEISLTRDGQPVLLAGREGAFDPARVTAPGRETLSFPLSPGRYECVVRETATGRTDRTARDVAPPGTFRGLARTVRVLMPGAPPLSAEDAGALFLRVLPGPTGTFREVCEVTAGFEHLCCEQTAAKIMAAFGAYLVSDSDRERQRLESIVQAGVERERLLWLRGKGLRLYEHDDRPSSTWGRVAVERLLALPVLAEQRGLPPTLRDALAALDEIARDCARPYDVELAPTQVRSSFDAYRGLVAGSMTATVVAREARGRARAAGGGGARGGHGEVLERVEACHAAAALLRIGNSDTLTEALAIVDRIGRQRAANGGFYSTHDSAAAIWMLHELSRLALLGGAAARVRVDGKPLRIEEASRLEEIGTLSAIDAPVLVEVGELREEDWTRFRGNAPVCVRLARAAGDGPLAPGDRAQLELSLEEYRDGDLAHVCLPPALARVHGGGRMQSFTVDFAGSASVSVPVAVVGGGTTAPGDPHRQGRQHYFACVRNMFEAERIGNPGVLEVALAA
jgi:hypothetical protein